KNGAEIDLENSVGDTALAFCVYGNSLECAGILIKNGADPLHKNSEGFSPFDLASPRMQEIFRTRG
ncbi:ankyrin repeat domain-containing protein, partial [Treponema berlinense]|uniref:ankyrin repeat domain-containing protein n=1 Tax=Treponema berlinense TaxID=225004 RepID=UPI0026ED1A5F